MTKEQNEAWHKWLLDGAEIDHLFGGLGDENYSRIVAIVWPNKNEVPNLKKAKEIALEHAEKIYSSDLSSAFDKPEDVLKYAKDVHQWLITDESKQQ